MKGSERGFVLSLVIFAVAALSIAATALYLVVQSEGAMVEGGAQSSTALHLANAGMARYISETIGAPDTLVHYEMTPGSVTVRAEPVYAISASEDMYVISAEARVSRPGGSTSSRVVQTFARLDRQPIDMIAAASLATPDLRTRNVAISGADACGGQPGVSGIAALNGSHDVRGTVGPSSTPTTYDYAAMMQALGVDWTALTDPALPFDYEIPDPDRWPDFTWGVAPGEYPTIRVRGDHRASGSGRGLLVVTGELRVQSDFDWDGLVLAGSVARNLNARASIRGGLVAGFSGPLGSVDLRNIQITYNSCTVAAAAAGISMFRTLRNSWWESIH